MSPQFAAFPGGTGKASASAAVASFVAADLDSPDRLPAYVEETSIVF